MFILLLSVENTKILFRGKYVFLGLVAFFITCVKWDYLTLEYLKEGVVKYKHKSGWLLVVLRRGDAGR